MLVYIIKQMAKKCDYKKWFVIGLLIVVIFFLFHSFSTINIFEGFNNKMDPCNKITNCNECSNANVGGSNPNQYGGVCGWCKKTGTCMSTEQNYYMANQDRCNCSTDDRDCTAVGCGNIKPDSNGTHPILKWYLILKKRATNTTDPSTTDTTTTDTTTTDTTTV
jgi:hypothetical protein